MDTGTTPGAEPSSGKAIPAELLPRLEEALLQLRTALSQARLYALESPQYQRVCHAVLSVWAGLLEAVGTLNLSVDQGEAVLNGERPALGPRAVQAVQALEQIFHGASLRGITLQPGIETEELGRFMQLVARRELGEADGHEINRRLRAQGVERVSVNEVIFVAVGEGDEVVSDAGASWGGGQAGGPNPAVLLRMTDRLMASLEHVPAGPPRDQVRARVAEEVVERDPQMAVEMVKAADGGSGAAYLASVRLDAERDARCLAAFARCWREGQPAGGTDVAVEFLEALLAPYEFRPDAWPVLGPALEPALRPLAPAWVRQAFLEATAGAVERAEALLRLPAAYLGQPQGSAEALALLETFAHQQDQERFRQILARLMEAAQEPHTPLRREAMRRLLAVAGQFQAGPFAFDEELERRAAEWARHETCEAIYRQLIQYLALRVRADYVSDQPDRAQRCFAWLQDFSGNANTMLAEASRIAAAARDELAGPAFIEALLAGAVTDTRPEGAALAILRELGAHALAPVRDAIARCEAPDLRRSLAGVLRRMGLKEEEWLLHAASQETDAARAGRLLEACVEFADGPAFWEEMPAYLSHSAPEVRRLALGLCLEHPGPQAALAVSQAAGGEADPEWWGQWLRALERLADPATIPAIGAILQRAREKGDSPTVLAALDVLALFNDPRIIPYVAPFLQTNLAQRITLRLRQSGSTAEAGCPKAERLRALEALGKLYQHPEAVALLEPWRKDADPETARTAVGVLHGLGRRNVPAVLRADA